MLKVFADNANTTHGTNGNIFTSGTDLLSLLTLFLLLLLGRPFQKKVLGSVVSNQMEMKYGTNVLQVNIRIEGQSRIFDLLSHFQDGGQDVISRKKTAAT